MERVEISAASINLPELVNQVCRERVPVELSDGQVPVARIVPTAESAFQGLVVIIDGLDRMISRPHEGANCLTTEYLFVHRSAQLTAFQCHVIYTMPLELVYSRHEQKLKSLYGGSLPVVPMTKIAKPPPSYDKPHKPGVDKFREIIRTRLKSVEATEQDLFANARVETELIKLSGGQPDELMRLVREAMIADDLPIKSAALNRCREDALRSYRRMLREDHWPLIEEVRHSGQIVRTRDNEEAFRELLESRAILQYRNADEWYGLHPAIERLEPPQPTKSILPESAT